MEKYAYDPWGARRNPNDWTQLPSPQGEGSGSGVRYLTNRGYTGHEHLDMFNIINMNGRVYDPLTAQFYSPDPFIQSGSDWKNYNRYSYCMNNPTRYTDPTGYLKESNDDPQPKLMPAICYFYGSQMYRPQTGGTGGGGSDYRYDWGSKTYTDSQGNFVSTNEAINNYINPNLGSASEGDVANLLSSLKSESGLNVYSVKFSSGYTSYAASVGDIGKATIDYNGGLSFSNSTAGMISMSMWEGESGSSLKTINDISNGLGFTNEIQSTLISAAVAGRRGMSMLNVNSISYLRVGADVATYMKYAKGLGVGASVITTAYSSVNVYNQYNKGGLDDVFSHRDILDATVGLTGLGATGLVTLGMISNPVGWAIGAGVLVYGVSTMAYDALNK